MCNRVPFCWLTMWDLSVVHPVHRGASRLGWAAGAGRCTLGWQVPFVLAALIILKVMLFMLNGHFRAAHVPPQRSVPPLLLLHL